jgi:hypothetical protein
MPPGTLSGGDQDRLRGRAFGAWGTLAPHYGAGGTRTLLGGPRDQAGEPR